MAPPNPHGLRYGGSDDGMSRTPADNDVESMRDAFRIDCAVAEGRGEEEDGNREHTMDMDESIQTFASRASTEVSNDASTTPQRPWRRGKARRSQSLPESFLPTKGSASPSTIPITSNRLRSSPTKKTKRKGSKLLRRRWSFDIFKLASPSAVESVRRQNSYSKDSTNGSKASTGDESNDDASPVEPQYGYELDTTMSKQTRVVTNETVPQVEKNEPKSEGAEEESAQPELEQSYSCSTAILQHTYFESICSRGTTGPDNQDTNDEEFESLPEDPTVQESIECIFESQLQEGLDLWNDEDATSDSSHAEYMISPATMLQTRASRLNHVASVSAERDPRAKVYRTASLKYIEQYEDSRVHSVGTNPPQHSRAPCPCHKNERIPAFGPEYWPQAPLLLRATPNSNMTIKGIRLSGSEDYLWVPGAPISWSDILAKRWGRQVHTKTRNSLSPCCEKCVALPVNNGNEEPGESLVVDFKTDLFEGSLLMRIRHSEGSTREPYDDSRGYFSGLNRRYQALVRGRFKKAIPITELTTGFVLQRPLSKPPSKWIMRGGLKVVSFFAPQLDAKFEGPKPYCLTPLGSAPQSISMDTLEIDNLEDPREEPKEAHRSLLGERSLASSTIQRARARKKAFDKLYVRHAKEPKTDPSKIVTFEFLQHLINFQDFSVELGSMLGSVNMGDVLGGQPMQFMAQHMGRPLWAFDLWHQVLWEPALQDQSSSKKR